MLSLMHEMRQPLKPDERLAYLPAWPGFGEVFKVDLAFAPREVSVQLPRRLDDEIAASPTPHRALAAALANAIRQVNTQRSAFDVLVIYLPLRWEHAFRNPEEEFDLHHAVKGITASLGIPSQIVLEDTATTKPHRCSVAWTLGVALYAKAGGVPWKLATAEERTAYIGISYALRPDASGHARFVTCCSQVFDAEGSGLEFVAYETSVDYVEIRGRNPFLDREQMRAVMARSLALYLERHFGELPRRVAVHKTTQFRDAEIDGCFDALGRVDEVELVQVIEDAPWRGVQLDAPRGGTGRGVPTRYRSSVAPCSTSAGTRRCSGPRATPQTSPTAAVTSRKASAFRDPWCCGAGPAAAPRRRWVLKCSR
ncbi:MAG: Piwi domain-containing protein [Actinomycetota bacterium]|nr:Piwi domain-containing protein [Actinomycetota bacterium]